ncbi:Hypothetical protein A7982_03378 [Minicystis rosea]|nr:Hypothetical protein A7982_03378 [Minicystis rosea]
MRFASIVAVAVLVLAAPAAAQDPPPPLPPADLPPEPPPSADKPPPSIDKPPPVVAEPPVAPPAIEPPASPSPARRDDTRTLRGHAFRPPLLLDNAFVSTHVDLSGSIGSESSPGIHVLATNAIGVAHELDYDAKLTVIGGRLQAGVRFAERFEIGLDASYAGHAVGDAQSAILFGGQSSFDVRPGLRITAVRSPGSGTAFGVRAYGAFSRSTRQSPARVIAEVAKDINAIAADNERSACLQVGDLACALREGFDALAATKIARATYGGGVSASVAQAFGSHFGLQGTAGVEVARGSSSSPDGSTIGSTPIAIYAGVAPSLDFAPAAPIGISAEYRFEYANESFSVPSSTGADASGSTSTIKHGVAAGLYYTGRRDLVLGAAFVGSFASPSSDGSALPGVNVLSGLVTMRYFF